MTTRISAKSGSGQQGVGGGHQPSLPLPSTTAAKPTHVKMTAAQWAKVPDNPRQRDTERHLRRAKHLLVPSETHSDVAMAVAADGSRWKLDGHTRALLWTQDPSLAPPTLHVRIFYVQGEEEAAQLYTHFDNIAAVETATDRLFGAYREHGFAPSSVFLSRGFGVAGALRRAHYFSEGYESGSPGSQTRSQVTTYSLVGDWRAELALLDTLHLAPARWSDPLFAAALLTIRRHSAKALPFWDAYDKDQGSKVGDEVDGVEALTKLVALTKGHKDRSSDRVRFIGRVLSCYEMWRVGRSYHITRGLVIKETNILRFLNVAPRRQPTPAEC